MFIVHTEIMLKQINIQISKMWPSITKPERKTSLEPGRNRLPGIPSRIDKNYKSDIRDKTIEYKLIYVPNDDKQYLPLVD